MTTKLDLFNKTQLKKDLPEIRPGDTIRVHQKVLASAKVAAGKGKKEEEDKERIQIFDGLVIAKKHGKGITSTITVRKVIDGVGVERILPVHSPLIEKIEIIKRGKVRKAKLYYLRKAKGKKTRLKKKEFAEAVVEEKPIEEALKEKIEQNKEAEATKKEE